jgi:hypothetical protein
VFVMGVGCYLTFMISMPGLTEIKSNVSINSLLLYNASNNDTY